MFRQIEDDKKNEVSFRHTGKFKFKIFSVVRSFKTGRENENTKNLLHFTFFSLPSIKKKKRKNTQTQNDSIRLKRKGNFSPSSSSKKNFPPPKLLPPFLWSHFLVLACPDCSLKCLPIKTSNDRERSLSSLSFSLSSLSFSLSSTPSFANCLWRKKGEPR